MARYRALTDIFTPAPECRYASAGDVLSDNPVGGEIPIPANWPPPTHAVDCLDQEAINAYFAVGPRFSEVEIWRQVFTNSGRWTDRPVAGPTTQWVPADVKDPSKGYQLNGAGPVQPPIP